MEVSVDSLVDEKAGVVEIRRIKLNNESLSTRWWMRRPASLNKTHQRVDNDSLVDEEAGVVK
jgi:hypothetical protein